MANNKQISIIPDFDPRRSILPEMPEEIMQYQRKQFKKRLIVIGALIAIIVTVIILVIIYINSNKKHNYNYIKLVSTHQSSIYDTQAGADIQGIEIQIENLKYYATQVAAYQDVVNKDNILDKPTFTDKDYTSLGNNGGYIVVKVKPNLQDPYITKFSIFEKSNNKYDQETYNIFIGLSSKGPWNFIGKYSGTAVINLKNYFSQPSGK